MDDLYYKKLVKNAFLILAVVSINFLKDHFGINQPPPPISAEQVIEEWNERHPMFQQVPQEPIEYPDSLLERLDPSYRRLWEARNKRRNKSNRVDEQRVYLEPDASISDTRAIPDTMSCGLVFYIDSH